MSIFDYKNIVAKFEGCRLTAYKCQAGKPTIGYGHTENVKMSDIITQEQADQMLEDDLAVYKAAVDNAVAVYLSDNEIEALTSLCFNIGIKAFTKSTLVRRINEGNRLEATREFVKWVKVKGDVNKGLLRRRLAEAALFIS